MVTMNILQHFFAFFVRYQSLGIQRKRAYRKDFYMHKKKKNLFTYFEKFIVLYLDKTNNANGITRSVCKHKAAK